MNAILQRLKKVTFHKVRAKQSNSSEQRAMMLGKANDDASKKKRLHLLALPREIRDMIYQYVTTDVAVSEGLRTENGTTIDVSWDPLFTIWGALCPNIQRVCGQIHDEYVECMRHRCNAILDIDVTDSGIVTPIEIPWRPLVPVAAFRNIRHCDITLWWDSAFIDDSVFKSPQWKAWKTAYHGGPAAPTPWKPVDATCDQAEALVESISTLVHPSATVTLHFVLDRLPDKTPPYWFHGTELANLSGAEARAVVAACHAYFDVDTALALEQAPRRRPIPGNFRVLFELAVPLYSVMAENSSEVAAGLRAFQRGEADHIVQPVTRRSDVLALWRMHPTTSGNNWMGFDPRFRGFMRKGEYVY